MEPADLELLRRHEPIVRFNEGEYFLPASVESFVAAAELWERTGPNERRRVAAAGELDLDRLVELTDGTRARHHLRLVAEPLHRGDLVAWRLRRDRPRFRSETRLGRVGVLARFVDTGARLSLLLRGRTPAGSQAAAAIADRDRPDHGDHPYYGRVVRDGGYVVLQYWFFSFFNDWRSRAHGVNDHEGDWEQVTIYCSSGADGVPAPVWVAYSAHDEVGADLRRRWDDPDLTVVDGHPVVHAGLGSHAGAYLAGEYLITVRRQDPGFLLRQLRHLRRIGHLLQPWTRERDHDGFGIPYVEYARGDGVAIGPGAERPWRAVPVSDETEWIRSYTGLWGDDTNDPFGGERGPAGPRYERDGTVRRSWGDPVGWAALDTVIPDVVERDRLVADRIEELRTEVDDLRNERHVLRGRLRAAVIGGATDTSAETAHLAELAAELSRRDDERHRLESQRGGGETEVHPHAHLSRRQVPLPVESEGRERVLKFWSFFSTPVVFALLALIVSSSERTTLRMAAAALVAVLALEALARRRLLAFAAGLVILVAATLATLVIADALIESWRLTLSVLLGALALGFLVLNLRELRRT